MTPPPELAKLRVEAFVLLGAAWIALDKDFDDVLWDAESEHDPDLLRELKERARPRAEFVRAGLGVSRSTPKLSSAKGPRDRADHPVLRVGSRGKAA